MQAADLKQHSRAEEEANQDAADDILPAVSSTPAAGQPEADEPRDSESPAVISPANRQSSAHRLMSLPPVQHDPVDRRRTDLHGRKGEPPPDAAQRENDDREARGPFAHAGPHSPRSYGFAHFGK